MIKHSSRTDSLVYKALLTVFCVTEMYAIGMYVLLLIFLVITWVFFLYKSSQSHKMGQEFLGIFRKEMPILQQNFINCFRL